MNIELLISFAMPECTLEVLRKGTEWQFILVKRSQEHMMGTFLKQPFCHFLIKKAMLNSITSTDSRRLKQAPPI